MSVVFYPGMGIDIVTPLVCVKDVYRIIATGPIQHERFGKGALDKMIHFICNLICSGTNEFYEGRDVDDDHFIEFLIEEGEIVKKYNFKKLQMYLLQFKYNERLVTLNYYYGILPDSKNADPWPFKDSFDYVIHKGFKLNVLSPKISFMKNLKPLLKPETQLIADKGTLRGVWRTAKDKVPEEPIAGYQRIVDQTKYRSEGQFQSMYLVNIYDAIPSSPSPPPPSSSQPPPPPSLSSSSSPSSSQDTIAQTLVE